MRTIFVVDDDPTQAETIALTLLGQGARVCVFDDPISAIQALGQNHVDLLITDLSMPWVDGEGLVATARLRQPDLPVLFISGYPRAEKVAARENATFLAKPFDADRLKQAVKDALEISQPVFAS